MSAEFRRNPVDRRLRRRQTEDYHQRVGLFNVTKSGLEFITILIFANFNIDVFVSGMLPWFNSVSKACITCLVYLK